MSSSTPFGCRCALLALVGLVLSGVTAARGGDRRTGLLVRTIDLQYFTTPYERATVLGGAYMGDLGSAASTIRNPAALANLCGPDVLGYWTTDSTEGVASLTPPPVGANQQTTAFLSDEGIYVAVPLDDFPISAGFGGDYFETNYYGNPTVRPAQHGSRLSAALAASVFGNVSIGYGATWFNDHFATAAWLGTAAERMANESHSWRHRVAMFAPAGYNMRWGVQGDYGYGDGTTRLDGEAIGGRNWFETYALRGGFQWDLTERVTGAFDFEWSYLELNMGQVVIGNAPHLMRYAADIYRPMVGIQLRATQNLTMRCGYRYSFYRLRTSPLLPDECDYSTVSGGARYAFWGGRAAIDWNMEHSWIAGGSLMNMLSLSCMF
ncbi:MAG: outer membrane beta-barrel protein [Thermoguttaceae bacterium]|nr:outer membrane beta-barrel protein [Thermoguttaceae bacterium]